MLRAVFFDFDGLILDTETPEVSVVKQMYREHGLEYPDEHWINSIGRGSDQILEKPLPMLVRLSESALDLYALQQEYKQRTKELISAQPLRPGIEPLLEEALASGIPTGIASSSKHDWVEGHLARLGQLWRFQKVVCADDVEHAKPFPDLYLLLMREMGVTVDEVFVLEDSPNGVAAARAAGLQVVAVENPLTMRLDLSAATLRLATLGGATIREIADSLARLR